MNQKEKYLKSLPKKRMAAGAIIFNDKNEILFLETTYKDHWEIPGGVIEDNESPIEGCKREIFEEIGLNLNINDLLCLEYQMEEYDDSLMFIFDGGNLCEKEIEKIKICEKEIKDFHFLVLDDAKHFLVPKLFKRIQKAVEVRSLKKNYYYETINN